MTVPLCRAPGAVRQRLAEQMIQVLICVREVVFFQAESLHHRDKQVTQQRGCWLLTIDGKMLTMSESTTGDNGRQVVIRVTAGVSHARTHHDDGRIQQWSPVCIGFCFQLIQKAIEAFHVFQLNLHQITDLVRIVTVMRKSVVAGLQCFAIDREDLTKPGQEHRGHTC